MSLTSDTILAFDAAIAGGAVILEVQLRLNFAITIGVAGTNSWALPNRGYITIVVSGTTLAGGKKVYINFNISFANSALNDCVPLIRPSSAYYVERSSVFPKLDCACI